MNMTRRWLMSLLALPLVVGCNLVAARDEVDTHKQSSTAVAPATEEQSGVTDRPFSKPQVSSFKAKTAQGDLDAPASGYRGELPRKVVKQPEVSFEAVVQNAVAVRFVIGSIVAKNGPIEQLGPFAPDASGYVKADWKLPRSGFAYIIWTDAIGSSAPSAGDLVDSAGNLLGSSGAIWLEFDQGE